LLAGSARNAEYRRMRLGLAFHAGDLTVGGRGVTGIRRHEAIAIG